MILHLQVHTAGFRYLWLKTVIGFDPRVHCARCLIGKYSKLLPFRGTPPGFSVEAELDTGDAPYLYLCGVAGRYADNLHLAMEPAPGEEVCYQDARLQVRVIGARQVSIPELPAEVTNGLTAPFHKCRNFRFGWHYFSPTVPPGATPPRLSPEHKILS